MVEAFNQCNNSEDKFKSDSITAIRLEKEFAILTNDRKSKLFNAWKQLAGDAHCLLADTSIVVYQHVLQHFWSCVALQEKKDHSVDQEHHSVNVYTILEKDEAEREACH